VTTTRLTAFLTPTLFCSMLLLIRIPLCGFISRSVFQFSGKGIGRIGRFEGLGRVYAFKCGFLPLGRVWGLWGGALAFGGRNLLLLSTAEPDWVAVFIHLVNVRSRCHTVSIA
jgi:hypothetical protein